MAEPLPGELRPFRPEGPPPQGMAKGVRRRLRMLEAAGFLLAARVALELLPFRHLAAFLGAAPSDGGTMASRDQEERAITIRSAMRSVCRPLGERRPSCLVRALAAKAMLRRRGIRGVCYVGTTHPVRSKVDAHAWLEVGRVKVIGGRARPKFQALGAFGEGGRAVGVDNAPHSGPGLPVPPST